MTTHETKLPGVLLFEPKVFADSRGYFLETFREDRYQQAGVLPRFVQDNMSYSKRGVLRGLHFQNPQGQGKLVQALQGEIFDVAVDIRHGSATFGIWVGEFLSDNDRRQLYVPPGFAHGFVVMSEFALVSYKCSDYYNAATEGSILWNDPDIGIEWPVSDPVLNAKDQSASLLKDISAERLQF